ncbi:MAG: 2-amino-4-hydroxy-6-hydroxymethyldihydropteridine diphosphokinase [Endomicrobium sp.]|jgi:2-amino-4-hydroxy-6-hydroxymethyldihydropteridine diphosphokinase|uniref:2-amino-4-hydroxy-6- hydroxymethyldihydropteridine diphosphokinase n=1 Tax=Candidatus Endomicrobiellum cubanum TaxID=3242325 RepID=UPI00282126A9|nr:2-amino-4-hydroxy-6-hydroxymethyldihydropteridine diphosphokinase [Endomicrobium sp.]MDR2396203.1 2-amino-4-hydroxy-6-hydroxymethyldihydropteridine diphosphokinase [Endomicrobium sp.]
MKYTIYLGLGSNIGNRAENIFTALSFMQSSLLIRIIKVSSLYETSPIGPKQKPFYNIAIKAKTNLNPCDLLFFLKRLEQILGRKKTIKWGPRIIDIDILFFNKKVLNNYLLSIPHKDVQNRLFVLVPLNEIEKNLLHPTLNKTIQLILKEKLLTLKKQKVKIIKINSDN